MGDQNGGVKTLAFLLTKCPLQPPRAYPGGAEFPTDQTSAEKVRSAHALGAFQQATGSSIIGFMDVRFAWSFVRPIVELFRPGSKPLRDCAFAQHADDAKVFA